MRNAEILAFPRRDELRPAPSGAAIALAVLLILCRTLGWAALSILAGAGFWRLLGGS